jgi:integral membrane protein
MTTDTKALLKQLFNVGYAEGVSYLVLLLIAMPLKYWGGIPMAVRITGSLHGVLFIWYIILLLQAYKAYKWPFSKLVKGGIVSLIPFGTFFLHKFIDDSK